MLHQEMRGCPKATAQHQALISLAGTRCQDEKVVRSEVVLLTQEAQVREKRNIQLLSKGLILHYWRALNMQTSC